MNPVIYSPILTEIIPLISFFLTEELTEQLEAAMLPFSQEQTLTPLSFRVQQVEHLPGTPPTEVREVCVCVCADLKKEYPVHLSDSVHCMYVSAYV